VLARIGHLIEELNGSGIRYCHWKSNYSLPETVLGRTDFDLLVHRQDACQFRKILTQQGFRPVQDTDRRPLPSMEHHFALDDDSGELVHVHAYYRVITGESLAKNYHLPLEEMLLQDTRAASAVRVPAREAELLTFTLRIMLKHTSLMELVLLSRYWKQAQAEMNWLAEDGSLEGALDLASIWLPPVEADLLSTCVAALRTPAPLWKRIVLGHRLRLRLRVYARHSTVRAWLSGAKTFTVMVVRRFGRSQKNLVPQSGGAVIAFVGAEATGKSTLLSEIGRWLGAHFVVERVHAGKPASTALTAIPNALLPALRALLPNYRSTRVATQYTSSKRVENPGKPFPLLYGVRSVLLAYDRRALLSRAFGRAANGAIVLCDRYPSQQSGAPDGPQLSHLPAPKGRVSVRRLLAHAEARLYRQIPPPDLVFYLTAPLEVTVSRNAARDKREPEEYVRWRHTLTSNLEFGKTPVHRVSTDQAFDQTVLEVKRAIWNGL
jgi:thymidylate kinase